MIPCIGNLSSYTIDILNKLFQKWLRIRPDEDFLKETQEGNVTDANREKLLSWIFKTWDALGVTNYTRELSWWIIDEFLKTTPVKKSILQLLGICSLQIAIKTNESFVYPLNILSELCGNQYSLSTILQFEEILLEKLDWNPYRVTASEVLNHMKSFFDEVAAESKNMLSEIFKSQEFASKVSIFIQIAVLDYELSRYGPFNLAIVAILWVLKSKDQLAEYYLFLEYILTMFDDEDFEAQLLNACKVATKLFGLHLDLNLPIKFEDEIDAEPADCHFEESDDDEVCQELNRSLSSVASQSTIWRSVNASPLPKVKKLIWVSSKKTDMKCNFLAPEARKRFLMFRKKKGKVICKRNLN